jgi:hypothetical protein
MIALPERAPGGVIAALTLLFVCAYAASLVVLAKPDGRIVFGDALHHYVQLRSVVFDRDLKFTNEYLHLYGPGAGQDSETDWIVKTNETGHIRNLMPVAGGPLESALSRRHRRCVDRRRGGRRRLSARRLRPCVPGVGGLQRCVRGRTGRAGVRAPLYRQ